MTANAAPDEDAQPRRPQRRRRPSLSRRATGTLGTLALVLALLGTVAGCQAQREREPVWYYFPGHDTFYSEPDNVYLVWDGRQWVQIRTRPEALVDEAAAPFAEVAPTPFAQWAPHPRSYKIPFDYEPYPYLQFRFSAPPARTPERPQPYYYGEQPYPHE